MRYVEFLESLFAEGRTVVPTAGVAIEATEQEAASDLIKELEIVHRQQLPHTAPDFVGDAASWAAMRFFRACQFAVYRDLGSEAINAEIGIPYDGPLTPEVHYSVDLVFRYLPDLTKLAQSAATDDPLIEGLRAWGRAWPLSSVGMSGLGEITIEEFASCPSLLQLYVDRVISRNDESRLADAAVREGVAAALGIYQDLSPSLAAALSKYSDHRKDNLE